MNGKPTSFLFYLAMIFLGGGLGALARGGLSHLVGRQLEGAFPYGTFAVNLAGCLLIGFLWGAAETYTLHTAARALIFTGFLGAFTTFSTFGLESTRLFLNGEAGVALLYLGLSNAAGLLLVFAGHAGARLLPLPGS